MHTIQVKIKVENEALTAVVIKSSIFWGITPYNSLIPIRLFGKNNCVYYRLHGYGFLLGLFFGAED
jgi:hypothetical protein